VIKAPALQLAFYVGVAIAVLLVAHGLLTVAGGGSGFSSTAVRTAYGLLQAAAGTAIAAGLVISARARRAGPLLVAAGVVTMSALWPWFVIVTIPVGVGLVAVAYLRARSVRPPSAGQRCVDE